MYPSTIPRDWQDLFQVASEENNGALSEMLASLLSRGEVPETRRANVGPQSRRAVGKLLEKVPRDRIYV